MTPSSSDNEHPERAGAPPVLRRVLETVLYVSDVVRARDWYRRVLRLSESTFEPPRHVFFPLEKGMLLLFNPQESLREGGSAPRHGASGTTHVAFEATHDEIPEWRRHLQTHGITIEKEREWPQGGKSLYFRDPDGNSLELATKDVWGL